MSAERIVADTMVMSWRLEESPPPISARYDEIIGSATVVISFETSMELRFGAINAGWGELRRRRLERDLGSYPVVEPDRRTIAVCAQLRADCRKAGHALAAKDHIGDLWIAVTAVRLGVPLVSDDGIFEAVPGLRLLSANT